MSPRADAVLKCGKAYTAWDSDRPIAVKTSLSPRVRSLARQNGETVLVCVAPPGLQTWPDEANVLVFRSAATPQPSKGNSFVLMVFRSVSLSFRTRNALSTAY